MSPNPGGNKNDKNLNYAALTLRKQCVRVLTYGGGCCTLLAVRGGQRAGWHLASRAA